METYNNLRMSAIIIVQKRCVSMQCLCSALKNQCVLKHIDIGEPKTPVFVYASLLT